MIKKIKIEKKKQKIKKKKIPVPEKVRVYCPKRGFFWVEKE